MEGVESEKEQTREVKVRKRKIFILALVLALICSAGCGKQAGGGAKGTARNPWIIGMSQCTLDEPWRVEMNARVKAAADKHPELKVLFQNAQDNVNTQQSQVRDLASRGVDLIIVSPKEAVPLTQPVAEAYKKGIPVIVLDRSVRGDQFTQFIGADNVKIGREAGKFAVKILGGKGNIVELKGLMTSTPGQDRHGGFIEGVKGSRIKIIFDADCEWKEQKARREMNSALARFPKIDAVYGHNDSQAHGAYMAAKQEGKGREKTIKFIGIDSLPHEGVKYVKDGVLTATFQYPTGGAEAIENAIKILKGEKVPKYIVLGTRLFTKENAEKGGEAL